VEREGDLKGRRIVVTGAAHGMGREHVLTLRRLGARVAAFDIDSEVLAQLADDDDVLTITCDVSDDGAVRAAVDAAAERLGGIDAVVSNAGTIHADEGLAETEDAEWHRTFAVHVDGALHLTRAALPHLCQSSSGRIVLISSMWAQRGPGFGHAYCAAKGALLAFGRNLAIELGPQGICVNSIAVGSIPTRMSASYSDADVAAEAATIPLRRWGEAGEISSVVAFLVSPASSFVTGQTISANGGQFIGGF
jgi:NAD(P)-dependent dehydrogenase (short-subunit alcohol dehydrogenase family)